MTNNPRDNIIAELARAGENQRLQERLTRLEACRITPEKEIPPREFLFKLFGIPCFPRGELVALTGKEKTGKTFISSILLTLCQTEEALAMQRNTEQTLNALWYDTEQSEESTQEILKHRILPMIETSPNPSQGGDLNVFNVRSLSWRDRLPMLELAIEQSKPDLIILDGIRDLVDDINDGVLSQEVVERLMQIASGNNCCIVAVLHQNKASEDKNLRGWIGTELAYKSFEVYECGKDADRIFTFTQTRTRKYDILDTMKYTVNEFGLPELCTVEELLEREWRKSPMQQSRGRQNINRKYILSEVGEKLVLDHYAIFTDCMPEEGKTYPALQLQQTVMREVGISSPFYYNTWKDLALRDQIIKQAPKDSSGRVYYYRPLSKSTVQPPGTEEAIPF